jgi:hypothetical protein
MLKEQFETAVAETRIRTSELIEAARAVLVNRLDVPEAAKQFGIADGSKIHRACSIIEKKWEEICVKRGWSFVAIALPKHLMDAMLTVQAFEIDEYRKARDKKSRKK